MNVKSCVVLSLLVAACAGVSPWIEPPEREPRPPLLAEGQLVGREVAIAEDGPWIERALTRPPRAPTAKVYRGPSGPTTGGPTTGGPATGGPTTGGGGGGYHGPGDAVPPTTPGGGGVVTESDDFYMGAGTPGPAGPSTPATRAFRAKSADGAAAPALRAGTTDDNLDHDAFVEFLAKARDDGLMEARCQDLDVCDRRSVRVVDRRGRSIAGAEVALVDPDTDEVLWRGTTYGDGAFPFFPAMLGAHDGKRSYLVEVGYGGRFIRTAWDGDGGEPTVRWPVEVMASDTLAIDVAFVIDTTGSMGDEIGRIKATLASVTEKLEGLEREVDLRYAAVLYRDLADAYVTKTHAFSDDLAAFAKALQAVEAKGGGDSPESLNQGLAVAVDGLEWRKGVAKVVFLIADAPPHMDYEGDVPYGDSLRAAVGDGIKIHSVAASGLDMAGSVVFRQIAHMTKGKFVFIEYDGDVEASAEAHGVGGRVKSNNLDDILFEQIRSEVATWGRS